MKASTDSNMPRSKTMEAAVFYGPNNIIVEERGLPADGLALKVNACAVCGYDVRVYRSGHRKVRPPVILGHEICAQAPDDYQDPTGQISPGSRVAVCPLVPCLSCGYCSAGMYNLCLNLREIGSNSNGGFAEYIAVPEETIKIGGLIAVPDCLSDKEAALLEPLACCVNGMESIVHDPLRRPVVIMGDGPIGLLHLQLFKNLLHSEVGLVGRIPARLDKARALGADAVFGPAEQADDLLEFTGKTGAGAVVIATSNPSALEAACAVAGRRSTICVFAGMPGGKSFSLDPNWLHYGQVSVTGSFSSTPDALKRASRVASEGLVKLSEIVSHGCDLAQISEAIAATESYLGLRSVVTFEC